MKNFIELIPVFSKDRDLFKAAIKLALYDKCSAYRKHKDKNVKLNIVEF